MIAILKIKYSFYIFDLDQCSEKLRHNKKFVLKLIKKYGKTFEYALKSLQDDKEVAKESVRQRGLSLFSPSKRLEMTMRL